MKDIKKYLLNEDSLDDFDIDGRFAQKRNNVSSLRKNKVNQKISKMMDKLYDFCDVFFKENNADLKRDEYTTPSSYLIYYPDLLWGYTYDDNNNVIFEIQLGAFSRIEGIPKNDSNDFVKELQRAILSKFKKCESDRYDIHVSAAPEWRWVLKIRIKTKYL